MRYLLKNGYNFTIIGQKNTNNTHPLITMTKQTLNEYKIQYITQEKIDNEMILRNITQEEAIIILNRRAEVIYNIVQVQPMTGPTGKIFKLKKKP